MTTLRQTITALAAAFVLAAFSVVSAFHMAPDLQASAQAAQLEALGLDATDICGPGDASHEHECPFCHKLPNPPRLSAPSPDRNLHVVWLANKATSLVFGAQQPRDQHEVRAPPSFV